MGINLKEVQKRLTELKSKSGGSGGSLFWRPEEGKNTIRIVPYQHNLDFPFITVYQHYNFSKLVKAPRPYVSPKTVGQSDPLIEFADRLKQTGEKEDWVLSKKFEPATRVYAPIIVRGKESEGVKFYGFGTTIFEELLRIIEDPDWGDITSLKEGRDITVDYTPREKSNTQYAETKIIVKPNQTPAVSDPEHIKLIKEQPNLVSTMTIPSYDELKEKLEEFMNKDTEEKVSGDDFDVSDDDPLDGDDNDDNNEDEVEETKESKGSSISDQLDELF